MLFSTSLIPAVILLEFWNNFAVVSKLSNKTKYAFKHCVRGVGLKQNGIHSLIVYSLPDDTRAWPR